MPGPYDVEIDAADVETVERCSYCERPFRTAHQRDLHLGEVHPDALTDEQRAAHEAAVETEEDDLFLFHMKVVVALGLLYSSTALAYTAIVGFTG